jgi:uncharacterized sulfatase
MRTQKPNFVFIMTDTQGANVISAYGDKRVHTPRVDALAAQGVRFERAYTTCPVCTPARAGIFSGQYPSSVGAWANELPLYTTTRTMGQRFRDAGYRTPYIGKWHLSGQDYFDSGICPDGWEDAYWYDGRRYLSELSDEEIRIWRQELPTTEGALKHDIPPSFTWANRISQRAIRFLAEDARRDQPFCLVLSYDEPHHPCAAPARYVEKYKDLVWDPGPSRNEQDSPGSPISHRRKRGEFRSQAEYVDGRLHYPPYFASNEYVDAEIGSVIDAVDRYAPDNTWIIYTSDHGDYLGAHGMSGKGLVMYDEAARIPLIVRPPRNIDAPRGVVDQTLASHVDILPTMLDLAGMEVYPIFAGQSLRANLLEGRQDPDKPVVVEWNRADVDVHDMLGLFPVRCYIRNGLKLVINLLDKDELYDLKTDSHEMSNRIDDPALAAQRDRMHDELIDWMNNTSDPFRGPQWCERPWHRSDRLLARGHAHMRPADGYLPPTLEYFTGKPLKQ